MTVITRVCHNISHFYSSISKVQNFDTTCTSQISLVDFTKRRNKNLGKCLRLFCSSALDIQKDRTERQRYPQLRFPRTILVHESPEGSRDLWPGYGFILNFINSVIKSSVSSDGFRQFFIKSLGYVELFYCTFRV